MNNALDAVPRSLRAYASECARRLRRNPRDSDALFAQAAILRAKGQPDVALANLDMLARVDPRYPGLWRFKARLYRDVGDDRMEALCLRAAEREGGRPGNGKRRSSRSRKESA